MTKYVLIISVGLILLTLFSCTHNNGGEAKLYGQWKLVRITNNGIDDTDYEGDIFWRFQNKTVEMRQVLPNHSYRATFGNYRMADQTIFLSFPDDDMPPLLSLPRDTEWGIVKLSGSEMVLQRGEPASIYYFKKW